MSITVLYVIVAAVIGAAAFSYYEHRQNTLVELNVGSHGVAVEKK